MSIGRKKAPASELPIGGHDTLAEAWRVQQDAAAVGFDWPDISGAFAKITEESVEIQQALDSNDVDHAQKELGDLLFSVVNLARFLDVDPRQALAESSTRFRRRFDALLERVHASGRRPEACELDELDRIWERIKGDSEGSETPLDIGGGDDANSPPI